MATFYLDPVNGNDANDGTTFANRWQTFTTGATAARIAPGDEIRVIASPDATSLEQNATWTNNSQTVILTTAVTADITQATSAWTATTNATTATSSNRKLGATSSSIAVNATFTTGKAAYLNLGGPQDLSGYQQVSFWIAMTAGSMTADGDITLRLCSDSTGDVTVNTISVPRIKATTQWQSYTVDLGTALGSGIQSIALYIAVDRGAQTFLINNVLACKASSSADSLSLNSLISKNTTDEPWFLIQNITGTTVTLAPHGQYSLATGATVGGYPFTTETVTTYKLEPLQLPSSIVGTSAGASLFGTINDSGTAGNLITFSGGWNRTDMSTQTGATYISGINNFGYCFNAGSTSYISMSKINPVKFYQGIVANSSTYSTYICRDVIGCDSGVSGIGGSNTVGTANTFTITNINQNNSAGFGINGAGAAEATINITNIVFNYVFGFNFNTTCSRKIINITNLSNNGASTGGNGLNINASTAYNNVINVINALNNQTSSFNINSSAFNTFNLSGNLTAYPQTSKNIIGISAGVTNTTFNLSGATLNSTNSSAYPIVISGHTANIKFINGTYNVANGTTASVYVSGFCSDFVIDNPTISVGATGEFFFNNVNSYPNQYVISRPDGVANNSVFYNNMASSMLPDTSIRHTASGISWKIRPPGFAAYPTNTTWPAKFKIASVAVNADGLVTASVWVYLTSANTITSLVCPGGQISGVAADVVATASTSTLNAWQQIQITFTPTSQGVVNIEVWNSSTIGQSSYIDDFTVSQA